MAKKQVKMHPEADLQKACVEWLRENGFFCLSVPNEAAYRRVNYFKDLGLLKGASDLIIIGLEQVFFIEFKSETGRLSKDQIAFKMKVEELGHKYLVIRYLSDLKKFFGHFE